jgi:hypothetical protein
MTPLRGTRYKVDLDEIYKLTSSVSIASTLTFVNRAIAWYVQTQSLFSIPALLATDSQGLPHERSRLLADQSALAPARQPPPRTPSSSVSGCVPKSCFVLSSGTIDANVCAGQPHDAPALEWQRLTHLQEKTHCKYLDIAVTTKILWESLLISNMLIIAVASFFILI